MCPKCGKQVSPIPNAVVQDCSCGYKRRANARDD